ncbi:Serine/threonine-protein kinase NIM1 [Frankliniella fusca]|uniref:non-specific serine/threonine protein kinase n=1 Tax=Frankliniella fusca TaxID=407009 RepID=A0AAE1HDR2_9NEOP|nr:Serine/threonine-protein kinase NIM1 [Frankliniella fusca]
MVTGGNMPAARVHSLPSQVVPTGTATGTECGGSTPYERLTLQLHHDRRWRQEVSLGKRVGLYRMRGDLGSGNFSTVKMAVHQLTSERVAIKILDKAKLDQKTRRMVTREVANMESVHHPNIIRLYEVVETYSKLHLVLEFAAGGELYHKISTLGRLPEAQAKVIFGQIASAVHYLHGRGIIHRDIKAENVFCAGPTLVKLGDFGFSTELTAGMQQQLNTFCGSPPYAAPELFRDESYRGPPVDTWALGVLLAFIVTGHMPFQAPTVASLKRHILEGHFSLPAHLSDECQGLIEAILRQTPSDRLTMDQVLASEWLRGTPLPKADDDQGDWVTLPTRVNSAAPAAAAEDGCTPAAPAPALTDIEVLARERLAALGIGAALLHENIDKGVRSPVIGTYRLAVHRLQKQASSQPPTPDTYPNGAALNGDSNGRASAGQDAGGPGRHSLQGNGALSGAGAGATSAGAAAAARGLFRKAKSAAAPKQEKESSGGQTTVRSRTCVLL